MCVRERRNGLVSLEVESYGGDEEDESVLRIFIGFECTFRCGLDLRFAFSSSSFFHSLFFFSFFLAAIFYFSSMYIAHFSNTSGSVYCLRDSQTSLFSNFFIKNWFHGTIHTFKNYFTIVFSVFSKINYIQIDP